MQTTVRERYLRLLREAFGEPRAVRIGAEEVAPWEPPRADLSNMDPGARLLAAFGGASQTMASAMHYVRPSRDGQANGYLWDEVTGMVYILD